MACDHNSKRTGCNWRLITARSSVLRDYANRNVIMPPWSVGRTRQPRLITHTMLPRRPSHCGLQGLRPTGSSVCLFCIQLGTPPYPDIHHIPIILSKPTGPLWFHANGFLCFSALPWRQTPGDPVANDEEAVDMCVEELTTSVQYATAASASKRWPRAVKLPPIPLVFWMKYDWRTGWGGSGKSRGVPL
jgi:hypothetical protein